MEVTITKGLDDDHISVRRADGSAADSRFPKKGPVPHDAIHYIVEQALGLARGFWGTIAEGLHPDEVQDRAKAGGHASAKRATPPDGAIIQLLQAERIVEAVEAALWSRSNDLDGIRDMAFVGCDASHLPCPELPDAALARIMADVGALFEDWVPAPIGHRFQFGWVRA